jgi:hypothetical protein
MDIQQEWDQLSAALNKTEDNEQAQPQIIQKESSGLYETLRKHLKYKLRYPFAFAILALIPGLLTEGSLRNVFIGISICYVVATFSMWFKLKKLPAQIDYAMISKAVLVQRVYLIKGILRGEKQWSYIFLPIAPLAGFLISKLIRVNDLGLVLSQINWFYAVPIGLALAWLGFYLANRMNNYAFGQYLDKLEQNIREMDK